MIVLQIFLTLYLLNFFARAVNEDQYNEDQYGDLKGGVVSGLVHFGFLVASVYFVWRGV